MPSTKTLVPPKVEGIPLMRRLKLIGCSAPNRERLPEVCVKSRPLTGLSATRAVSIVSPTRRCFGIGRRLIGNFDDRADAADAHLYVNAQPFHRPARRAFVDGRFLKSARRRRDFINSGRKRRNFIKTVVDSSARCAIHLFRHLSR